MKKINKKRKGFTIVELVIVIAVIAILAGVLIPTFANVIEKANQSSDIQAVRQMNVILMAESVEEKPTGVDRVIEIISEGGYDTVEKRTPKSKGYSFYWHSGTNTIILAKDEGGNELIYPKDNELLSTEFNESLSDENGFYDLKQYASVDEQGDLVPEGTSLSTIKELFEKGGVYTLEGDIRITEPIYINNNLTINLNEHNIYLDPASDVEESLLPISSIMNINGLGTIYSYVSNDTYLTIKSSGELNLRNTNLELTGDYGIVNEGGKVMIDGGVFTANNSNYYDNVLLYNNFGEMNVTNTIFREAENSTKYYSCQAPIVNGHGTIEMIKVNISSSNYCTALRPYIDSEICKIIIDSTSQLELKGVLKAPAPCEEYYAYNNYWGAPTNNIFTDNENIVFEYEGNKDPILSRNETITLEGDIIWKDITNYFLDSLTIDLQGHTLTLNGSDFSGGTLNIINSSDEAGGIELTDTGQDWSVDDYFDVKKITISADEGKNININVKYNILSADVINMVLSKKLYDTEIECEFVNCTFTNANLFIKSGNTIVLTDNISIGSNITIPQSGVFTFDLNEHSFGLSNRGIIIEENASLIIKNGNFSKDERLEENMFTVNGSLQLEEVEMYVSENLWNKIITSDNIVIKETKITSNVNYYPLDVLLTKESGSVDIVIYKNFSFNRFGFKTISSDTTVSVNITADCILQISPAYEDINCYGNLIISGDGTLGAYLSKQIIAHGNGKVTLGVDKYISNGSNVEKNVFIKNHVQGNFE